MPAERRSRRTAVVRRAGVVVALALLATLSAVATAVAYQRGRAVTEPNAHGVIALCYDVGTGAPRMVNAGTRCAQGERSLSWRQHPPSPQVFHVGAPGAAPYQGLWQDYFGPPFGNAAYYKDASHVVHLEGLTCKQGCTGGITTGTEAMFVLPLGFRPSTEQVFTVLDAKTSTYLNIRVDVTPDGAVEVVAPPLAGFTWVSLQGISFLAG